MLALVFAAALAFVLANGMIFFGTFVVDPFLLFVLGDLMTQFIYKKIVPRVRYSTARRICPLLFVVSLVVLTVGVWLPYFNLVDPKNVYFGLLPQWFVGPATGNSFMWNGLGVHLIFGGNIVPDTLLPTYRYLGFNILAVLVWLSYPVIQGLGVLDYGNAEALLEKPALGRWLFRRIKVMAIGASLSLVVAALAALLVRFYS